MKHPPLYLLSGNLFFLEVKVVGPKEFSSKDLCLRNSYYCKDTENWGCS